MCFFGAASLISSILRSSAEDQQCTQISSEQARSTSLTCQRQHYLLPCHSTSADAVTGIGDMIWWRESAGSGSLILPIDLQKKHSKYSSAGMWACWDLPFSTCLSLMLAGIFCWGSLLLCQHYWCPDVGLLCGVSLRVDWGQSNSMIKTRLKLVPEPVCALSPQGSWPRGAISLEISSCTQPLIDGKVPPTLYFNTKTQMQAAIQT